MVTSSAFFEIKSISQFDNKYVFSSGQTPIMLAIDNEDDDMVNFLRDYMCDIQSTSPNKLPWKFEGPWRLNGKNYIYMKIYPTSNVLLF